MLKAIIFASVLVSPTFAMDKVIYGGEDNRKDFYDVSEAMQKLAASTVALVEQNQIYFDNQSLAHIGQRTLEDENQMCSDEPFIHQPAAASCSGFLVAPNIVLRYPKYKKQIYNHSHKNQLHRQVYVRFH